MPWRRGQPASHPVAAPPGWPPHPHCTDSATEKSLPAGEGQALPSPGVEQLLSLLCEAVTVSG